MKKLFFIAVLIIASFAADAQITHRFGFVRDFELKNPTFSADSSTKSYTISVVFFDKDIALRHLGKFEYVTNYKFTVADGKTLKQERAIALDSLQALRVRLFPNF